MRYNAPFTVMRRLDPRIHVHPLEIPREKGVDGHVKHGHDEL